MRKLNCQPGDLAIIVKAFHPVNIGSIVRVIRKHRNQKGISCEPDDFIWMVEAAHPLTYSKNSKISCRKKGGAPDSFLRPIRGRPPEKDIARLAVDDIKSGDLRAFEVDESGTISDSTVLEPQTNADIFEVDDFDTVESLICCVENCQSLLNAFLQLACDKSLALNEDVGTSALKSALQDEDFGWMEWIRLEGEDGLHEFINFIKAWLDEPIDWCNVELSSNDHSGVTVAKHFFERLDGTTLEALGVDIIEGEHPGSSYYAAELRQDVDYANQVARDLGLKFRFRQV